MHAIPVARIGLKDGPNSNLNDKRNPARTDLRHVGSVLQAAGRKLSSTKLLTSIQKTVVIAGHGVEIASSFLRFNLRVDGVDTVDGMDKARTQPAASTQARG